MFAYHSLQREVWKTPFQWISDSGTTIAANPASLSHNLRPAFSCWHWPCFYHYYHWTSLNISKSFVTEDFIKYGQGTFVNPLRPIGSPVTHENWPMNWPNFAASPALRGWSACNRHHAACIHRFSHILRWPPEPVLWFMSESRAVAIEHEGYKRTLSIISSSFWMAVGLKGLSSIILKSEFNYLCQMWLLMDFNIVFLKINILLIQMLIL